MQAHPPCAETIAVQECINSIIFVSCIYHQIGLLEYAVLVVLVQNIVWPDSTIFATTTTTIQKELQYWPLCITNSSSSSWSYFVVPVGFATEPQGAALTYNTICILPPGGITYKIFI